MDIVIDHAAWLHAALGGLLIGLSVVLLLAVNGRIAGIAGIASGLMHLRHLNELGWRGLFLAGLMLGALCSRLWLGPSPITLQADSTGMIVAGLLVGFGTRLGGGCTSGHGVCGIARLSPRSITATATFMAFGALTVFVVRHVVSHS